MSQSGGGRVCAFHFPSRYARERAQRAAAIAKLSQVRVEAQLRGQAWHEASGHLRQLTGRPVHVDPRLWTQALAVDSRGSLDLLVKRLRAKGVGLVIEPDALWVVPARPAPADR